MTFSNSYLKMKLAKKIIDAKNVFMFFYYLKKTFLTFFKNAFFNGFLFFGT